MGMVLRRAAIVLAEYGLGTVSQLQLSKDLERDYRCK